MTDGDDTPRRASWRDYTIHPDVHHDFESGPRGASENGAYVLCRSDGGCEEAAYNPERAYLDLGTAVNWAKGHHARHVRAEIEEEPGRDLMRAAFTLGGPDALEGLDDPQGSKLILDPPERGQPVTVTFDDGRVLRGWYLGDSIQRCKDSSGMGDADLVDLQLVIPDDPRRASIHFRDNFEPVAEKIEVWTDSPPQLDDEAWQPRPYAGEPVADRLIVVAPMPDMACICTIENRTGLIYDREAGCPQHDPRTGCICTHVPALNPTGPTPGLADCPRHAPIDCACPDELAFGYDCPLHQPEPGQCRRCSGRDGQHVLRDCAR